MQPSIRLWLILSAVYGLAVAYRLQVVDIIEVGSDTLSPIWAAMGVLHHGWADPPNPESDHWLWLTHLPLMWGRSLHEVFVLRCAQAALIAPLGAYAVWLLSSQRTAVSLLAGLLLALDPGLRDTLVVGFRGYGAPEWLMLSFLGLVAYLNHRRLGILIFGVAWVIAAGQHSLTLGAVFGVGYLALSLKAPRRDLLFLMAGVGMAFLPRVFWVSEIMQCDEGGIQCLLTIASGSSEGDQRMGALLLRGLQDRFHVEWSWMAVVGLFGLRWIADHRLSRGVLLMAAGILILGLALHTLRPYHLRIFVGPLVVCAAVGWWTKFGKWGEGVLAVWLGGMVAFQMAPIGAPLALQSHDEIGRQLSRIDLKVWVETKYIGEDLYFDPSAAVVSAYLQGWDTDYLACSPNEAKWFSVIKQSGHEWETVESPQRDAVGLFFEGSGTEPSTITMYDAAVQVCDFLELE